MFWRGSGAVPAGVVVRVVGAVLSRESYFGASRSAYLCSPGRERWEYSRSLR